jgi:hypothetical protein
MFYLCIVFIQLLFVFYCHYLFINVPTVILMTCSTSNLLDLCNAECMNEWMNGMMCTSSWCARSACWRQFQWWISPYYQTSCNEDYNAYVGCVDKSDKMVNSAEITQTTWKWKKVVFPRHRHGHPQCIWHTRISRRFLFMIWSSNYLKQMWQLGALLGSFYILCP